MLFILGLVDVRLARHARHAHVFGSQTVFVWTYKETANARFYMVLRHASLFPHKYVMHDTDQIATETLRLREEA